MSSILVKGIEKSYEDIHALKPVNLEVNEGEIFGLIGPDGAGKTTLIRILTSLMLPDEGEAYVMGHDVVKEYKKVRQLIGYMPGKFALYTDLTIEENLNLFAGIFETTIEKNYHLIAPIYSQIEPFKDRQAGQLSGGMKQKLALSCALIHKPEVLFLDEPTTGVDPVSRKEFWDMLKDLKKHGITIFVSTPYMDEANRCDRIALIQDGKILSVATPHEVENQFQRELYSIKAGNMHLLITHLREYENTHSAYPFGETCHFSPKERLDLEHLSDYLKVKCKKSFRIEKIKPSIEDSFIELMVKEDGK